MTEYRVEKWNGLDEPHREAMVGAMHAEGFSVFEWTDAPGSRYADHEHGDDQSHWVLSGTLELTVRGAGRFELGPGDRDFMPAGTIHSARVVGSEPVVYLIGTKR